MSFFGYILHPTAPNKKVTFARKPSLLMIGDLVEGPPERVAGFTTYLEHEDGIAYRNGDSIRFGMPFNTEATRAWRKQIPGFKLLGPVLIIFGG